MPARALVRPLVRNLVHGLVDWRGAATSTVPAQFVDTTDFDVIDLATAGDIQIQIINLPSDGGSAITALQFDVDADVSWGSVGGIVPGNYNKSGFTDGVGIGIRVRAVNINGPGSPSNAIPVTPTGSVPVISVTTGSGYVGSTYTSTIAGQWTADAVNIGGETGATYVISLANEGKAIRCGLSNTIEMWVPTDLGVKLIERWDARAGITLNGGDVASWLGQKSSYAAAQATGANQPAYSATGLPVVSLPGVVFTKANSDVLTVTGNSERSQPFFRAAMASCASLHNGAIVAGTDASHRTDFTPGSDGLIYGYGGTGSPVTSNSYTANQPFVAGIQLDGATSFMRLNGVQGTTLNAGTHTSKVAFIGSLGPVSGSFFYDGTISEMIDADNTTSDERLQIEGYLAHRWNRATVLDAGHTYKTLPPFI